MCFVIPEILSDEDGSAQLHKTLEKLRLDQIGKSEQKYHVHVFKYKDKKMIVYITKGPLAYEIHIE